VTIRTTAAFSREVPHGVQHVPGSFITHPQLVSSAHRFDYSLLLRDLHEQIETFNKNGSNFNLDYITQFVIVITHYRPLAGLSYIPTPPHIEKKNAVINVVNKNDKCLRWSVLAGLYPPKYNATRVCSYTRYRDTLNFHGIPFPVQISDIAKFEKQNPTISVNVISPDGNDKGFCVEYLSPHRERQHHVNLLLYGDPEGITYHYVYIKNFSRLLGDRTKHEHESFVCNSCLNVFSSQRVLDEHFPKCLQHKPQQVAYPDPDDPDECKLRYKDHDKEHAQKFYHVCNFESFLMPSSEQPDSDAKTRIVDEHQVSGFCCYRVTHLSQYQTPPKVYRGPDVLTHFYQHIMAENKTINDIMSEQLPLAPMSDNDRRRHYAASTCHNCGCHFTRKNFKVGITIT